MIQFSLLSFCHCDMSLVNQILDVSDRIPVDRDEYTILAHVMEEVGELAQEISISCGGKSYKQQGPDGIIGESIDAILCLVDMIYIHAEKNGIDISEEMLMAIARKKLDKWEEKCQLYIASSAVTSEPDTNPSLVQTLLHKLKLLFSTKSESK